MIQVPAGELGQLMQTAPTEPRRDALATLRIDRSSKPKQVAKKPKGLLYLLLFLLVGVGGTAAAFRAGFLDSGMFGIEVPDVLKKRPEVRLVRAVVERGRSADATVVATGYLESRRQAKIGARSVGRVQSVAVEEGSRVKKDEILAVLEHADLDASLAANQANLSKAKAAIEEQKVLIQRTKREYDRAKTLLASQSISDADHDRARFDYEGALAKLKSMEADLELSEARLSEAQQLRENMFIRAPFDGTVISKDAEVGESIMPGGMGEASGRGSAVTIADLENLEVDCDVKEDFISRVRSGQAAEVAVDAVPGHRFHGVVRKVIPMGDRARATIKVKVAITDADERLFPNMSSTVYFLPEAGAEEDTSQAPRTFCPEDSIREDDQGDFVWTVDNKHRAQKLRLTVGKRKDGRAEIVSGLPADAKFIANPPELQPNQPVKVYQ